MKMKCSLFAAFALTVCNMASAQFSPNSTNPEEVNLKNLVYLNTYSNWEWSVPSSGDGLELTAWYTESGVDDPHDTVMRIRGNILYFDGKMEAEEVEVTNVNLPDYVFEEDYELQSLEEVEAFIQANKHLPDVPSAAEVAENGMNVAEMTNVVLRKVEELTLHMIDMKKENDALKKQVELLSASR